MSINFKARNDVKLSGALKGFTEKHLQNLEAIAGNIIDAEVIVGEEKLKFTAEISMKTRLSSFYAEASDKILKQALRNALGSLKTQAKKFKEKLKVEKKRNGQKWPPKQFAESAGYGPDANIRGGADTQVRDRAENQPPTTKQPVLISDNYSRKPLTVEEAVFFLEEKQENAYMFINSETNRMAVIFCNRDGGLSLIEPQF